MPHEIDVHQVVRWLDGLERRYRRLRWIAGGSFLVALAAIGLALVAYSGRNRIEAREIRTPERPHTGRVRLGAAEGRDAEVVLQGPDDLSLVAIRAGRDGTSLHAQDRTLGGRRMALRLSPAGAAQGGPESPADPSHRASGLRGRWPGATDEDARIVALEGDDEVLSLELHDAARGTFRVWSGARGEPAGVTDEEARRAAVREPGTALRMIDPEGRERIELSLLLPPPAGEGEEARAPAGPAPALLLRDERGNARVGVTLDETGSPSMILRDHLGRTRVRLVLDGNEDPHLELLNAAGETVWSAP